MKLRSLPPLQQSASLPNRHPLKIHRQRAGLDGHQVSRMQAAIARAKGGYDASSTWLATESGPVGVRRITRTNISHPQRRVFVFEGMGKAFPSGSQVVRAFAHNGAEVWLWENELPEGTKAMQNNLDSRQLHLTRQMEALFAFGAVNISGLPEVVFADSFGCGKFGALAGRDRSIFKNAQRGILSSPQLELARDPLPFIATFYGKNGTTVFDECRENVAHLAVLDIDTVWFSGGQDRINDPAATDRAFAAYQPPTARKLHVRFPEAGHRLYSSEENTRYSLYLTLLAKVSAGVDITAEAQSAGLLVSV